MYPSFEIFGRTIGMYGLMIVLGIILGIGIATLRAKKHSLPREDVLFASFFAGIGLYLGAKFLYILTLLPGFISYRRIILQNPSLLLSLLTGGFVFYGGLIGGILGIYLYCRIYRIEVLRMLDLLIPSIPFIHGFGRLGCFFAGCCYGIPYNGPGHVIFHNSVAAPNEVPLFPTQLLESGLNFLAALILFLLSRKKRKPGNITGFYLIYYALLRFILEFYRGDLERGIILGLSLSQWISLAIIPVGIILISGIRKPNNE